MLKISQSRTARALRNLVNSYQVIQVGSRFRDVLRSIGAEKSRHVDAKSQRFLDFNFSKAFLGLLVSFLKILSFHSTTNNQSENMEDFRNLKKGNFYKKTLLKLKWSEPDTYPSYVVELFVYFSRFDFWNNWSLCILRRPQNFAKSSPYFCPNVVPVKSKVKISQPSQNIWTLSPWLL